MIDYLMSFEFNSRLALFIYWIPMLICLIVYFCEWVIRYRNDIRKCDDKFYNPTLTVGLIVWQIILSTVPAVNLFALVFDVMSSVFNYIGKFLSIPLVSGKYRDSEK